MQNVDIAHRLEEIADLLEVQHANPYRVQAYRRVAASVRQLRTPLMQVWQSHGDEGLREVTGAGERMIVTLRTLLTTGRLPMLERLRGEADPTAILESVPGIGPSLAQRLHDELGIETLEDLEAAANDGRLHDLAGVGKKKLSGIIDTLACRLGRLRNVAHLHEDDEPTVEELLDVDHEYREEAAAGKLPTIAPRRFNPKGIAWLPVLHTQRGERHYTALFSNTAKAHELGTVEDWVVLYYDGGYTERQATVITSKRGELEGLRIVRGREPECEQYYAINLLEREHEAEPIGAGSSAR